MGDTLDRNIEIYYVSSGHELKVFTMDGGDNAKERKFIHAGRGFQKPLQTVFRTSKNGFEKAGRKVSVSYSEKNLEQYCCYRKGAYCGRIKMPKGAVNLQKWHPSHSLGVLIL